MSESGEGDRSGAARMARRHSGPATRDELAPGMLMRALGVGVDDEGAAAGDRADPAPSAARARLAVAAVIAGTALLAGVLGPGAGPGRYSGESGSNMPAAAGVAGSVESQGDSFVKTKKFGSDVVLGAAAAAAVSMSALAGDAVQWRVADGGNGHWYQGVGYPTQGVSWTAAREDASIHGAELVTFENLAESSWVFSAIVAQESLWNLDCGPWVGAYQSTGSVEPSGGWIWVDGTPVGSTFNWAAGQPDDARNCGGDNNRMHYWRQGSAVPINLLADAPDAASFTCPQGYVGIFRSAVFEWSADCNSDNIVDYGQILAGTLDDANANGVPDRCECATNPGLPSCCLGDIVNDRTVNGADLGTLLAYWGPVKSGAFSIASDLNNDGDIDGSDLGILLAYWGACPTANVPAWATLIEAMPDPTVVTDPALRTAIAATGLAWRVRDTGTGIEMLLVPPGIFQMGCIMGSNMYECYSWEQPVHQVTLTNAFYIARYEMTQAQWVAKMGSNPSQFQGAADSANRPVEKVSWTAIQSYLSTTNMRLPTEAEWEFACRAGTQSPFYNGSSDDNTVGALAWYNGNSSSQTHAVGGKAPNALGLYDMLGNVWEWVNDWYGPYSASSEVNPTGPTSGTKHVIRGGCWVFVTAGTRASIRDSVEPDYLDQYGGFRVARNP